MILSRAPLRISIGGGGTDLPSYYSKYGGFILGAAINKYIYICINKTTLDDYLRIKYSTFEQVTKLEDIKHDLVRPTLEIFGIDKNVEIASIADISASTGLGSSSTFMVALLTALYEFKHMKISAQELVEQSCHIEIDIAGHPAGKQDHYTAAFGGIVCMDIDTDGNVKMYPLNISLIAKQEFKNNVLLFYTGITRPKNNILSQQRELTLKGDSNIIDSLHYTKELGYEIKETLELGDIEYFGELLHKHWLNKKRRSEQISNPKIDYWYDLARKNGAIGGKIMGAGGAGFFMFYVPNKYKLGLRSVMSNEGLRELLYDFDSYGARIVMNVE